MKDIYKLLECEIQRFNYVSFDLFDTLAFRRVNQPENIFELVEKRYYEVYHEKIKGFAYKRIEAELQARKSRKSEITIDEIYEELLVKNENIKTKLKALEKETEIESIIPHTEMVEIANRCIERNQQVVITTDMYLDRDTISKILQKIGVKYNQLFISGEARCTKLSGELFDYVLDHLEIEPTEIVHIGDDKLKDILRAKEKGIKAFLSYLPSRLLGYGNINVRDENDRETQKANYVSTAFDIGYKILGPFILEFCKWIHDNSIKFNAAHLVFVAREGFLIKQVYERIYPKEKEACSYICLNKNLLRFPILFLEPTIENFMSTIPSRSLLAIDELLRYFNLNESERKTFLRDNIDFISQDSVFDMVGLLNNEKFVHVFRNLLKIKSSEIQKQYELFMDYIVKQKLTTGTILLINNSFDGNGQKLLERILSLSNIETKVELVGIQFARSYKCNSNNIKSVGWLNNIKSDTFAYAFNRYALIFEHLLFESIGTAVSLEKDGIVYSYRGAESLNDNVLNSIQQYTIEYAEDYSKKLQFSIDREAVDNMMRLFELPTFSEALLIGDLYDCDVHGTTLLIDVTNIKLRNNICDVFRIRKYAGLRWRQGVMALKLIEPSIMKLYNALTKINDKKALNQARGK